MNNNDFNPNCEQRRPMADPPGGPEGGDAPVCGRPRRGRHGHRRGHDLDYDALPLEGKLAANLREIAHFARHGGGKGGQGRILGILARRGSMTQRELMELVDVRSGSLSEVLGKLEAAEYVVRTPNGEDRRSVDVALTEKGRQAAEEAFARRAQMIAELFLALNEDEKAQLNALLEKLGADWRARFRGVDADDGGPGPRGNGGGHARRGCGHEGEGPR